MSAVARGVFRSVSKQYKALVASRCAAVGVKYEDLLVEEADVEKALQRIPADLLQAREQRIKRAFDCSVKRKTLPLENQPSDPLDLYLGSELALAQKDREERIILNNW